ncbi:hypothetical protein SAMN04488107_1206 [Geodermatophilus saharensis]|uniref:Uncharacterized protein n=1 Tax=Geodermatophilus saharensis TaxID=1137994 RepID=A0A239BHV3_9ACTN|nr:hypothetical protein [Geodermatophilus saharensis]SNS07560.1 hypothetical protein SAMN04488107_1206 [Geodermatophilus saharensis]
MSETTDWVEQARRLVAGLGQGGLGEGGLGRVWAEVRADGHLPGGDCRWCPVCQFAAVARRPEVTEALADALVGAATALRALAAAAAESAAREDAAAPQEAPEEPVAPPPAPVQHIEIG